MAIFYFYMFYVYIGKVGMIKAIQPCNSSIKNILNSSSRRVENKKTSFVENFKNYPISFTSSQIKKYPKGTTPFVAYQLKSLNGTLDEKILKAKDIILKDMGLPIDLIECVDEDLSGSGYAAFSPALGQIIIDKNACKNPNAQFSDNAILCILRHELDHLEVFAKLYKKLGKDEFEKLVLGSEFLVGMLPPEKRKINHELYSKMAEYVNIDDFNADIFVNAIKDYFPAVLGESPYKNFTGITKNFNNALESLAQDKQYQLEQLMGVDTLKNFYSMINETAKFEQKIKNKGVVNEKEMQEIFDKLYAQAQKETCLENKPENWAKIIQSASKLNKYNKKPLN